MAILFPILVYDLKSLLKILNHMILNHKPRTMIAGLKM